jgi:hypothetical protein
MMINAQGMKINLFCETPMNFLSYKTITRSLVQLVSGKNKGYATRILMFKENATGTGSLQFSRFTDCDL